VSGHIPDYFLSYTIAVAQGRTTSSDGELMSHTRGSWARGHVVGTPRPRRPPQPFARGLGPSLTCGTLAHVSRMSC